MEAVKSTYSSIFWNQKLLKVRINNSGEEFLTELQNRFRADLLWCGINNDAPSYFAVSANYPDLDLCCREVR